MKTLELYRDKQKKHRWRVVAPNGRIQATGAEGYNRFQPCFDAACAVLRVEYSMGKLLGYAYQVHAAGGAAFKEVMRLKVEELKKVK